MQDKKETRKNIIRIFHSAKFLSRRRWCIWVLSPENIALPAFNLLRKVERASTRGKKTNHMAAAGEIEEFSSCENIIDTFASYITFSFYINFHNSLKFNFQKNRSPPFIS